MVLGYQSLRYFDSFHFTQYKSSKDYRLRSRKKTLQSTNSCLRHAAIANTRNFRSR